ncbi:unnamed protein product, partial [Urochloa humidicola]
PEATAPYQAACVSAYPRHGRPAFRFQWISGSVFASPVWSRLLFVIGPESRFAYRFLRVSSVLRSPCSLIISSCSGVESVIVLNVVPVFSWFHRKWLLLLYLTFPLEGLTVVCVFELCACGTTAGPRKMKFLSMWIWFWWTIRRTECMLRYLVQRQRNLSHLSKKGRSSELDRKIPKYVFDLTDFEEFPARVGQVEYFVDAIGIIVDVSKTAQVHLPSSNGSTAK